jgi:hypothetical protein
MKLRSRITYLSALNPPMLVDQMKLDSWAFRLEDRDEFVPTGKAILLGEAIGAVDWLAVRDGVFSELDLPGKQAERFVGGKEMDLG